ncbi:hypothetical protein [Streptomyces sp. WAC04189]|uniref:hypothetical protein n=1 Tax=Streptomyces sp. WAC04189 TaxID=2487411 RepID=UPI0021B08786|nr:hypothetical protein [Streptomyces sp. WAC04189]
MSDQPQTNPADDHLADALRQKFRTLQAQRRKIMAERDDRNRTHIKALIEALKEQSPDRLAQPAGLFISGMLTGLAGSVQILDGGTADQVMETTHAQLEASIGRAYLNGTLPDTFSDKVLSVELRRIDAILRDLGVEGELGARGVATLANTVRTMREELQRAENFQGRARAYEQRARDRADRIDDLTARRDALRQQLAEQEAETMRQHERAQQAEAERDGAYRERAHLVALLAAMTDGAVIAPAPDVDEPGWQIAYLTIGGHQATWHISPRDADLVAHIEPVEPDDPRAQWDGHSTELKYARIAAHTAELAERCGPACAEGHTYTGRCEGAHPVDDSAAVTPSTGSEQRDVQQ